MFNVNTFFVISLSYIATPHPFLIEFVKIVFRNKTTANLGGIKTLKIFKSNRL